MNYLSVLNKYNLTEDQVSPAIRKKIAAITELNGDIEQVKKMLEDGNLSVKKRERMETDLEEAERLLPELDEKLCAAIESWYPKREQYAEKGKALKAAREAKKNGANSSRPAPSTSVVQKENKAAPAAPATSISGDSNTKKKGISGWGWFGIAALALLTVVGVSIHNNGK